MSSVYVPERFFHCNEIKLGEVATAKIVNPPLERTVFICSSKRLPADDARNAMVGLVKETAKELVIAEKWQGARWR